MITAHIHYDKNFFDTCVRRYLRERGNTRATLFRLFVSVMLWGMAVLYASRDQWPLTIGFAVGGILYPVLTLLQRRSYRRVFDQSPLLNEEFTLNLQEEGFQVSSPNEDSFLRWPRFTKVVEFADGYLLYQGPNMFNWIPITSLENPNEAAALGDLLRRHIHDHRTIASIEIPGEATFDH